MYRVSSKITGFTILEVLVYLFALSIIMAVLLSSFRWVKNYMQTINREQLRIDKVWKISAFYDYLMAGEANNLFGLKRLYTGSGELIIPVVSPYDPSLDSLKDAKEGFYLGKCKDDDLVIYSIQNGKSKKVFGECEPFLFYHLGYGGVPAFVILREESGRLFMEEGVEKEIFRTDLGPGEFQVIMKKSNGDNVEDSSLADFISIKFLPENLEVATWKEK